jgi:adenylate cyclase class 2
MGKELEAKVRVESHEPVRARLTAVGAVRAGASGQVNRFLDTADRRLLAAGCGLRLRTADNGAAVTFKGPFEQGPFKLREELETEVGDASVLQGILERLGLQVTFEFHKRRESWTLDGCHVELDSVPGLGEFVEVEGPDEPAIRAVLGKLGLDALPVIKTGYVELLLAQRGAGGA